MSASSLFSRIFARLFLNPSPTILSFLQQHCLFSAALYTSTLHSSYAYLPLGASTFRWHLVTLHLISDFSTVKKRSNKEESQWPSEQPSGAMGTPTVQVWHPGGGTVTVLKPWSLSGRGTPLPSSCAQIYR